MSDYVVYHNTESNENSLVDNKTKAKAYTFDIYTNKNIDDLLGKIIWIIEGRLEPGDRRKSYYLCERFRVHKIKNNCDNGANWAVGKAGDGERYIGRQKILLNGLTWFPEFFHRMGHFSRGLTPLSKEDRSNFIGAIKRFGYSDALESMRPTGNATGAEAGVPSEEAMTPSSPSYGQGYGDSESNIEIDLAAMRCVTEYYEKAKWTVLNRSNIQNLGYDLLCKKRSIEHHVEVKGCRGKKKEVFIKASQKRCAENNSCFILAIVTNALANPELNFYTGAELLRDFDFVPIEYRASLRSKNSIRLRGDHHASR